MKKGILFLFFCLIMQCVHAQGEGVVFQPLSFAEAMQKAAQEKKLIFIDFYTEWCGPCKQMSREVFPQGKVGDWFNPRFVCLKVDAEKGEGKELAQKYRVRAYPTFVVLKADGTEVYTTSGARPADEFVEKIRKGIDPKWSPEGLTRRYKKGERDPELVKDYAILQLEGGHTDEGLQVINDYFKSLSPKKRVKAENFFLYSEFAMRLSDEKARYMLDNKERFVKANGLEPVETLLRNWLRIELIPYTTLRSPQPAAPEGLQQVKALIDRAALTDKGTLPELVEIAEVRVTGDWKKYLEKCREKFPTLDKGSRFSILLNMTELMNESEEIKSMAAALIRDHMEGNEEMSQRILRMGMLKLEGKKDYNFRAKVDGCEQGKVVVMSFTNRGISQDTFPFTNHEIAWSIAGRDTMSVSMRIISDEVGCPTKELGVNYPTVSLLLTPGEFAVVKMKVEKGKAPHMEWVKGGEVSHDFIRLNYEQASPEELAYRQLVIDNVIRGGDIREYKVELDTFMKANRQTVMNFVRQNPQSYISAMKLLENYFWFDENEIEEIYNRFPEALRNTQCARMLKRRLDAGKEFRTGTMAQDFVKKDMQGKTITLSKFRGKYVLLDFWGSWCGPCRASHPHLKQLYEKYRKKVVFLQVANENIRDLAEAKAAWTKAVKEDGLTWTQILNNENRENYDLVNLFHITAFPTKILIDPEGRIVGRFVGTQADPEEMLQEIFG